MQMVALQAPNTPRRIVVISDFQDGDWRDAQFETIAWFRQQWLSGNRGPLPERTVNPKQNVEVAGGYIERLPLAVLKGGLADHAEIWTHSRGALPLTHRPDGSPFLTR